MMNQGLVCPLCAGPLMQLGNALRCPKGHSFDVAKEGYTNLLPVQKKRAKLPGDSKEMVDARSRFLEGGSYRIFADALARLCVQAAQQQDEPLHILDMGCGEGYYNRIIAQALCQQGLAFELIGLDIAKAAVQRAAKRAPEHCTYAVASCFSCPVKTGWADLIINVFAPFAREESLRLLRAGGRLIYAVPGPKHLFGLKQVLYDTPYDNPVQKIDYPGFTAEGQQEVQGEICVEKSSIQDLFCMTPYYWKTPREGAQRLAQCDELHTPIQFRFLQFSKQ